MALARHNLGTVIGFEFVRTIKKRGFAIATLAIPLLLILVFALVFASNVSSHASADAQKEAKFAFTYSDASGIIMSAGAKLAGGTYTDNPAAAIEAVKNGQSEAYFEYPADPSKEPVKVYGADKGMFENGKYEAVAKQLLEASAQYQVGSPKLTAALTGTVKFDSETFKDGQPAAGVGGVIPPMLFLVVFYISMILLSNQMLNSTLEEKENRVTEMILTTLNPTTLITGKIISLFMVGLVQIGVFLAPVGLAYVFFRLPGSAGSERVLPGLRARAPAYRGAAPARRVHRLHRGPGRHRGDHAHGQGSRHNLRAADGHDVHPLLHIQHGHLQPWRLDCAGLHVLPADRTGHRPAPERLRHPLPGRGDHRHYRAPGRRGPHHPPRRAPVPVRVHRIRPKTLHRRHLAPQRIGCQVDAEFVRSSPCSGRRCCARLPAWMTREAVSCRSSAKVNTFYGLVVLIHGFASAARTPF